jgi:hypothetical protein
VYRNDPVNHALSAIIDPSPLNSHLPWIAGLPPQEPVHRAKSKPVTQGTETNLDLVEFLRQLDNQSQGNSYVDKYFQRMKNKNISVQQLMASTKIEALSELGIDSHDCFTFMDAIVRLRQERYAKRVECLKRQIAID